MYFLILKNSMTAGFWQPAGNFQRCVRIEKQRRSKISWSRKTPKNKQKTKNNTSKEAVFSIFGTVYNFWFNQQYFKVFSVQSSSYSPPPCWIFRSFCVFLFFFLFALVPCSYITHRKRKKIISKVDKNKWRKRKFIHTTRILWIFVLVWPQVNGFI